MAAFCEICHDDVQMFDHLQADESEEDEDSEDEEKEGARFRWFNDLFAFNTGRSSSCSPDLLCSSNFQDPHFYLPTLSSSELAYLHSVLTSP